MALAMRRLFNVYKRQWEKGVLQKDVSSAAGIPKASYVQILTGRVLPTADEMKRIARVLEAEPRDLFPEIYFQIVEGEADAADRRC